MCVEYSGKTKLSCISIQKPIFEKPQLTHRFWMQNLHQSIQHNNTLQLVATEVQESSYAKKNHHKV